mmetsp:Transcript_1990/g.5323  ORF Transcript_1990/g.5323 Transcript_1990/m.5323 type:complete len:220 (-) Transcript_1990:294-953(-)
MLGHARDDSRPTRPGSCWPRRSSIGRRRQAVRRSTRTARTSRAAARSCRREHSTHPEPSARRRGGWSLPSERTATRPRARPRRATHRSEAGRRPAARHPQAVGHRTLPRRRNVRGALYCPSPSAAVSPPARPSCRYATRAPREERRSRPTNGPSASRARPCHRLARALLGRAQRPTRGDAQPPCRCWRRLASTERQTPHRAPCRSSAMEAREARVPRRE